MTILIIRRLGSLARAWLGAPADGSRGPRRSASVATLAGCLVATTVLACSGDGNDWRRDAGERTHPGSGGSGNDTSSSSNTSSASSNAAAGSGGGPIGSGTASDTGEGSDGVLVGVETPGRGCKLPRITGFSDFDTLEESEGLPDPFEMIDGTPVADRDQWVCRHRETSVLLQRYELGTKPSRPASVTGSMSGDSIEVTVVDADDNELTFSAAIEYPNTGDEPYPALIALGTAPDIKGAVEELGVAVIDFNHDQMGNQSGQRGVGQFFHFNEGADAGALLAWSWGVSRLIDALEVTPEAQVDASRLAVNGCSRNGKGALMIGALDARIALTIPQESGSGGVASWRVSQADADAGGDIQTLQSAATEQPWFRERFYWFGSYVERTPIDHHQVLGMVAPRGLFVIGNVEFEWLGRNSGNQSVYAAKKVFDALGVSDHIGHVESSHGHCQFPTNEVPELQQYVRRFLLDEDVVTDSWVLTHEEDESWTDWNVPELE